jgi:predicted NAD-dependent protein-ADP-ribosyltransferase YbiA (DUF1768 family)
MTDFGSMAIKLGGWATGWDCTAYHIREFRAAKSWGFPKVGHLTTAVIGCIPVISTIYGIFDRIVRALIEWYQSRSAASNSNRQNNNIPGGGSGGQNKSASEKIIAQIKAIADRDQVVCFYKTGETGCFGNFYESPITIRNKTFKCSEAAFQWMKFHEGAWDKLGTSGATDFDNSEEMKKFFSCSGEEAYKNSRIVDGKGKLANKGKSLYPDTWSQGLRDTFMWDILKVKFAPGTEMRKRLDATGKAYLLEFNVQGKDDYWSYCNNTQKGQNKLGIMLMAIRDNKTECPDYKDRSHEQKMKEYVKEITVEKVNKGTKVKYKQNPAYLIC